MPRISLLNIAHDRVRANLNPGAIAIDATVGNGNDTLFLLQQIQPTGRVYGFDVQQAALDSARSKIRQTERQDCLTLFHASHASMAERIPERHHGQISVCMFNLGYLPGGDKTVITQTESTLAALSAACKLLSASGMITIVAYPGHPGGDEETAQVKRWCGRLDADQFTVSTIFSAEHKASAPRLFVVRKVG